MPFVENLMGTGVPPSTASAMAGNGVTGLVATGTSATDALLLSNSFNGITTSSASTGVKLPKVTQGWCGVANRSGQTVTIYPNTGQTVDATTSITIANGKKMILFLTSSTTWESLLGA